MLKLLRQKKVMKRILWALALIIIPAFVLWGAGGLREQNYAGTIFRKKVTLDEYRESLNAVKNRALLIYGSRLYQMRDKINLEEEAWEYLIMLSEAKRKNIKVSDNEVIERILSFSFFRNKDGTFNKSAYEAILQSTFRTSPRRFEEEMRQSVMIEKLVQEALKGVAEPDELEIEEAIKREAEKKDKTKEDKKETLEERRERIKSDLLIAKTAKVYQDWRKDLYKRANLVSNLRREEVIEEAEIEKIKEEKEKEEE